MVEVFIAIRLVILVAVGVLAGTVAMKAISGWVGKLKTKSNDGPSLTSVELQHLLQQAVEVGNRPLYHKIQELERKIDRVQLQQGSRVAQLESGYLMEHEVELVARVRE